MGKETILDNKVFKDFLDYLDNATPEQLEEDWKQIEKLNKYGPLMGDLIREALEKNKEQDIIKSRECGLWIFNSNFPASPIISDGYGGFKIKPDHEVTTISTSFLKTKTEQ